MAIKLISSDLNGILVHQHTMSDMIRIYKREEDFRKADGIFKKQIRGNATIGDALKIAGPLSKGIRLRQAIMYTQNHMIYLKGFKEFLEYLHHKKIPLIINSTGYSVVFYCMQEQFGAEKIHGFIGNALIFGLDGNPNNPISEEELRKKIKAFFSRKAASRENKEYDRIKAVGKVKLGIKNEADKARLIKKYLQKNFVGLSINEVAHIGDSMGDSQGIFEIAKSGGLGIAFNYNRELEMFLEKKMKNDVIKGKIIFIDKKTEDADLRHIIQYLK